MTALCNYGLLSLILLAAVPLHAGEDKTPLLVSAANGDITAVRQLLNAGEDINQTGFADYTALMEAAYHGQTDCLRILLAAGADANRTDAFDCSALSYAALRGHTECVRLLLSAPGIELNRKDRDGETPLFKTCRSGQKECARLLLSTPGIDINTRNHMGESAFIVASRYADTLALFRPFSDSLRLTEDDREMYGPLWLGDDEVNIVLLSILKPADIPLALLGQMLNSENPEPIMKAILAHPSFCLNSRDEDEKTLLHYAVTDGNAKAVKLLLDAGADVSRLDGFHYYEPECHRLIEHARDVRNAEIRRNLLTPLHCAIMEQNPSQLHALLQAGNDVNMTDANDRTPLHFALSFIHGSEQECHQNYIRCVTILLSTPGVDVNRKTGTGDSALHLAVKTESAECLQAILSKSGVNLNDNNNDGNTALHLAADQADGKCLRLLLISPEIMVNVCDSEGKTPLLRAAQKGNDACVQLLLSTPGIDINQPDASGRTPLTAAAERGHHECVRLLSQDNRTELLARDAKGMTALHYACCKRNGAQWLPWLLKSPLEPTLLNALLETAVCSRSAEAVRILMQQAEVDAGLVIHLILKAVENLHAECEKVLLEVSDEE